MPVEVDREILKSLPRSEVIVKNWGCRAGNQYYKVLLPEVPLTVCKECQQVNCSTNYTSRDYTCCSPDVPC